MFRVQCELQGLRLHLGERKHAMSAPLVIATLTTLTLQVFAAVWQVPADLPTIQTALNQIQEGDTIQISAGQYNEALIGPEFGFHMIGEVRPDSQAHSGVIVDIGDLAGADSLSCLTVHRGTVTCDSLFFVNSTGAHDTDRTRVGGVEAREANLILRSCLFDAAGVRLESGTQLIAERCSFFNIHDAAILSGGARLDLLGCAFSGNGFWQVTAGSGSQIIECLFADNTRGHLLVASGDSIVIDGCEFRDFGPYPFTPVEIWVGRGCLIHDCRFSNIQIGPEVLRTIMLCDSLEDSRLEISNVVFEDFAGGFGQGGTALEIGCHWDHTYDSGLPVAVSGCEFRGGMVVDVFTTAINTSIPIQVDSSEFSNLEPVSLPACRLDPPQGGEHSEFHNCGFDSNLLAIIAGDSVDARWNWWGDSSGPTELIGNPDGIGAEIRGPILYVPWLTSHPDSTDTTNISIDNEHFEFQPSSFTLAVFPNPFNAVATLVIEVARAGEYDVKLYDVTGREAAALFSGRVEMRAEVSVNASGLASGVYFAALRDRQSNLAVTKVLLLK